MIKKRLNTTKTLKLLEEEIKNYYIEKNYYFYNNKNYNEFYEKIGFKFYKKLENKYNIPVFNKYDLINCAKYATEMANAKYYEKNILRKIFKDKNK